MIQKVDQSVGRLHDMFSWVYSVPEEKYQDMTEMH